MDVHLKALKVVDLKALLVDASVPVPPRANKTDLIAKITASPPAVALWKSRHRPADLATPPPPEVPATVIDPPAAAPLVAKTVNPSSGEDSEAEKRRKRAERFGIAVVEPSKPPPVRSAAPEKPFPLDDPKKLEARAARFSAKRSAPTENIDSEEEERRRKRAERFGTGPKTTA